MPTPPHHDHYALHAYVLAGQVHRLEPYSRVTFRHIYQNRPNEARYAVAGEYDVNVRSDRYLVWDLFEVRKDAVTHEIITPEPRLAHTDLDAALMATVLLYGDKPP